MAFVKSARGTVDVALVSPSQAGFSRSLQGKVNASLTNPALGNYGKSARGRVNVSLVNPPGPGPYFIVNGVRRPTKTFFSLPGRSASLHPFAETSPFNMPLGSGAIFESATDTRTAQFLAGNPETNSTSWSVAIFTGTQDDPLVTVTSRESSQTWQIRIPSNAAPTAGYDGHMSVIQQGGPDDGYVYEFYAATKVSDTSWITTYNLIRNNLKGSGIAGGRVASLVAQSAGIIRQHEVDTLVIPHGVAISLPKIALKKTPTSADGLALGPNSSGAGWVWPANGADNQANQPYSGTNAIGTVYAIPPSVNLLSLNLTAEGMALGKCLQDYGAIVTIQAETVSIRGEPSVNAASFGRMRTAWRTQLHPLMRRITNFTPGTLDSSRLPVNPLTVGAWTGTPRAARAPEFI